MPRPIKVCHIAHGDLWAGAEVQLAALLEALAHDSTWELSAIVLNEGRLASDIAKLGIPVTVFSEGQYSSFGLFTRIARHLKQSCPDIIHTHKYKDTILGACAAASACVPTVVRTIHGMTEPFLGTAYLKMMGYELLDRLIISTRVKKLIAVSCNIAATLGSLYGLDKVVQIHNGINLEAVKASHDREDVRQGLGIQADDYVIGTVGRLTPVKGHEILLRAVSSLRKTKTRNIRLLIVGDGPLISKLKDLMRELNIENQVILAGQRDDVYDLVTCMDVFALPSLHEGIPMVLLEALALKRPVVASRVGGIPEVLEHGRSGLLVSPGNVMELVEAIDRILNDRLYAIQLAQAGRDRMEVQFSSTVMAKRVAHLYGSLVDARV
jgi:L-malate glycosyltransferase